MACSQYVAYFYGRSDWKTVRRDDFSRVNWHRITSDLNIHHCYSVIAQIRREAKAQGRKPTMQDMESALGLDRATIEELLKRYQAKQGMTGSVVEKENALD